MNRFFCVLGIGLALFGLTASAQLLPPKVARVEIQHVGPVNVSDDLIRANIRVRPGDTYQPTAVDDDVRNLYATGQFYNVRVTATRTDDNQLTLTYIVQAKPRLTDIKFTGNKKFSNARLRKKVTSKVGEPLDERKLFTDSQAIQELYQKSGYPRTTVKYVVNVDEPAGRGTATFEITESPKVKIARVEFVGAQAFPQKRLRREVKTRKRGLFSWITGRGVLKPEELEQDRDRLAEFYRDRGYIDFDIINIETEQISPREMVVRFHIFEGQPYKVGAVTFSGTTLLPTNAVQPDFKPGRPPKDRTLRRQWAEAANLHRAFVMKPGMVFTPKGLERNTEAVENFYGAKGHIDVTPGSPNLRVKRLANTQTRTMDLQFDINEGQPSYVEKIEIRGNTKTKDHVIRRELAVAPGELFDMVRVKVSQRRLEGLNYFEKVDLRPEDTTIPNRKNLIVDVEEKTTGSISVGAGFSSVDAIVGFVEFNQGNFDLFKPPTFTGGGQKFRLRVQLGTRRQDYIVSFIEPWFLGRKLALGVDLYHRELNFQSVGNLYDERRTGARLSLTRALWSDFFIGSIYYNIESVGIDLDGSLHGPLLVREELPGRGQIIHVIPANAPRALLDEAGDSLLSRIGVGLAYDTRNSTRLPDAGQRTELSVEFTGGPLGGDHEFYKTELRTAWYFRGLRKGHVLELVGRIGFADSFGDRDVPFYERYYLGGLYSLRGFRYRGVSPREPGFNEPVGGNSYWFGSAEYSIPIIQKEKVGGVRFAVFYDIGSVSADAYDLDVSNFSDNWGVGLRLDLPIGPLRLDYGVPIHHDRYNSGSGRFQFGVGYTREF
ncbi:MAG: outer membrane protein assembly factor BamA [Verrucomicrobiales bacterium]|nr:outer membrane protein assembly factor BamA [Verrucomicrobiales bacterium]